MSKTRINKRDNYIEWFNARNELLASAEKHEDKWIFHEYHDSAKHTKEIVNFKRRNKFW